MFIYVFLILTVYVLVCAPTAENRYRADYHRHVGSEKTEGRKCQAGRGQAGKLSIATKHADRQASRETRRQRDGHTRDMQTEDRKTERREKDSRQA
jgi:hypothetical protein